ncbi:MAG: Mini-ribonuclease 3 [Lachnospiraceae bacterium]
MGEDIDLFQYTAEYFGGQNKDCDMYSPLTLAYIGDGIYEIIVRTIVVTRDGNEQVNKLHKKSSGLVKAETQAKIIRLIMNNLTEEEERIYKRGRNAKSFTSAKNASIGDYRTATGFEALVGYLYIKGRTGRLFEIIRLGLEKLEEDKA